jgi:uncharacterized repeat protein (TIGR02543 family)
LVYDITVVNSEHGSIEVNSTARVGAKVGLDVVPDEHYHLKSVAGDDVTLNHVEGNHYTFTMPKGNVTLRAEFDPDTYEVIWKDYDGTALQTDTVTYGESYTVAPPPEREGYRFVGWFDAPEGGNPMTDAEGNSLAAWTSLDENKTFYAVWEEVPEGEAE